MAVIVEFTNQQHSHQALQLINVTHSELEITNIVDMRLILKHPHSSFSHTLRYNESTHQSTQRLDDLEMNDSNSEYSEFTYHLRYVPLSLSHEMLQYNLSYYGQIEKLQEVEHLPST